LVPLVVSSMVPNGIGQNLLPIKFHLSRGKVAQDHPLSGSRVRGQGERVATRAGLQAQEVSASSEPAVRSAYYAVHAISVPTISVNVLPPAERQLFPCFLISNDRHFEKKEGMD
jgi:hypothetical protein